MTQVVAPHNKNRNSEYRKLMAAAEAAEEKRLAPHAADVAANLEYMKTKKAVARKAQRASAKAASGAAGLSGGIDL